MIHDGWKLQRQMLDRLIFSADSADLFVGRLPPLAIQLNNTTLVNRLQTAEGCQHSYFLCIFFSKLITTTIHLCHF